MKLTDDEGWIYVNLVLEIPHCVRCRSHVLNSLLKCLCPSNPSLLPWPYPQRERRTSELSSPFPVPTKGLSLSAAQQVCSCKWKGLFPNGRFLGPKPYFLFPPGQFNLSSQIAKPNAIIAHVFIPVSWQPQHKFQNELLCFQLPFLPCSAFDLIWAVFSPTLLGNW